VVGVLAMRRVEIGGRSARLPLARARLIVFAGGGDRARAGGKVWLLSLRAGRGQAAVGSARMRFSAVM